MTIDEEKVCQSNSTEFKSRSIILQQPIMLILLKLFQRISYNLYFAKYIVTFAVYNCYEMIATHYHISFS